MVLIVETIFTQIIFMVGSVTVFDLYNCDTNEGSNIDCRTPGRLLAFHNPAIIVICVYVLVRYLVSAPSL